MPALPLDEAGKYVAGAYVVFLTLIIIYVAIIGAKISRIERQVVELLDEFEAREEPGPSPGVQPSRDGEESTQSVGQDAPQELIPTGGPGSEPPEKPTEERRT